MPTTIDATTARARDAHARPAAGALALDDLLDLDHGALVSLYEQATLPELSAVRGDLRGRMLAAGPVLPAWLYRLPRAWARTGSFPWRGKSFVPGADAGHGDNRVGSERLHVFRFDTRVGASRHDGKPVIDLDYDHAGNPFFIRAIEDEIRQVRPGLFLGQAWLRTGRTKTFVLWFGLTERGM